MGNTNASQPCPVCPWEGKNRYYHMRQKHHFTMSDWTEFTEEQRQQAKEGVPLFVIRFGEHGENLPYKTFK